MDSNTNYDDISFREVYDYAVTLVAIEIATIYSHRDSSIAEPMENAAAELDVILKDAKGHISEFTPELSISNLHELMESLSHTQKIQILVEILHGNPFNPFDFNDVKSLGKRRIQAVKRIFADKKNPILEAVAVEVVCNCYQHVHQTLLRVIKKKQRYEMLRTPRNLAAGTVLTLAAAGVAVFFAPAIATLMPAAAGLSGAAAVAAGLAALGGGSLASGGLGMAGGMWLLALIGGSVGAAGGGIAARQSTGRTAIDIFGQNYIGVLQNELKKLLTTSALVTGGVLDGNDLLSRLNGLFVDANDQDFQPLDADFDGSVIEALERISQRLVERIELERYRNSPKSKTVRDLEALQFYIACIETAHTELSVTD